jgi:EAL domain-containing protein (putative c-di-GMP-specific phosphodiesterase class I)
MEDSETVRARLLALKDLGFMLCIDDFGTGYSSLRYLKRWPVDMLKIDQSFVREMITDPGYGAVVRAILALAKALKLGVVAEGVETDAQLAFLQQYGCEACQGYYFSRPVSAGRFAEMLTLTHHG